MYYKFKLGFLTILYFNLGPMGMFSWILQCVLPNNRGKEKEKNTNNPITQPNQPDPPRLVQKMPTTQPIP